MVTLKYINFLFIFLFSCLSKLPIDFYREEIKIKISNQKISVFGYYFLKNLRKEKITTLLFYPFPLDSSHSYPDSISSNLSFVKLDSGIQMKISFLPKEEKSFYVYYEQRLNKNIARYITKTTKHWKRPLKQADFEIELPESLSNLKISYPIDKIKRENKTIKIYIQKRNFFPEEDIIISW